MKFSVSQKDFAAALSVVARAVGGKVSHPILANIRIVATGGRLLMTGYDLSTGIRVVCPAEIEQDGDFTLPCTLLKECVDKLSSSDQIVFTLDGERMIMSVPTGKFTIPGLPSDEYPSLPIVDGESATVDSDILLEGVGGCLPYVSSDQSKQVLCGVHVTATEQSIEFAATDGHRLAKSNTTVEDGCEFSLTLPSDSLKHLSHLIQPGIDVTIAWDGATAIFDIPGRTLLCRVLDGQYPNYNQLIPTRFENHIVVDRAEIVAAIERVKVFADSRNNVVTLTTGDQITITADGKDAGSGYQTVAAQNNGESGTVIAFNVKYLLEPLKSLAAVEVSINWNSSTSPVVIRPLGGTGEVLHLVMPVQIRA